MQTLNQQKVNFQLKGTNNKAVLLIHGITGTPTEMRYVGGQLNRAGYTVLCKMLPGHGTTLSELKKVTWQEIAGFCENDFLELKSRYRQVFVGGLSIGALIAIHIAYKYPGGVSGIIGFGPTVFYDGWAHYKGRFLLELVWRIPFLRNSIVVRESWPYGLKDEVLREKVHRFYQKATRKKGNKNNLSFGTPYFPIACLYQGHLLARTVKKELHHVKSPIIILHSSNDDMASRKNAEYVFERIASLNKYLVILEDSYHMITIDQEKEKVAQEVIGFLRKI